MSERKNPVRALSQAGFFGQRSQHTKGGEKKKGGRRWVKEDSRKGKADYRSCFEKLGGEEAIILSWIVIQNSEKRGGEEGYRGKRERNLKGGTHKLWGTFWVITRGDIPSLWGLSREEEREGKGSGWLSGMTWSRDSTSLGTYVGGEEGKRNKE